MYTAIHTLHRMLEEANIPHTHTPFNPAHMSTDGYQIRLTETIDAVQHFYSYGQEKDLIEIMGALTVEELEDDAVLGYLTAEEVFKRFKFCYENNTDIYVE